MSRSARRNREAGPHAEREDYFQRPLAGRLRPGTGRTGGEGQGPGGRGGRLDLEDRDVPDPVLRGDAEPARSLFAEPDAFDEQEAALLQELSDDLLALWSDPRLCRHFHLSLQSGSADVLRRMRRSPDVGAVLRRIEAALNARAGYRLHMGPESTEVFVNLGNLLDEQYEYRAGYPMPGRTWSMGIDVRL